jgi:tetratricopeptide (TPR) repeat protein
MAQIGDFKLAQTLVEELNQKYPSDTLIQKYWLPTIRARMELKQKNWAKGLETLSVTEPFDFAATPALATSTLYPAYVRGEIYAAAGNEKQAVAEFSKLIAHPGMVLNFPLGALARLRSAQAYAVLGNSAKARESYQEFFELWKEADSGLPILKQAKAEYAKLQ